MNEFEANKGDSGDKIEISGCSTFALDAILLTIIKNNKQYTQLKRTKHAKMIETFTDSVSLGHQHGYDPTHSDGSNHDLRPTVRYGGKLRNNAWLYANNKTNSMHVPCTDDRR